MSSNVLVIEFHVYEILQLSKRKDKHVAKLSPRVYNYYMKLRRTYRIYPNKEQEQKLLQATGNCRWIWNHMVELNKTEYDSSKKFIWFAEMANKLPGLKLEHDWLASTYAHSLQGVCRELDKTLKGIKRGGGFPRFKNKDSDNSITYYRSKLIKNRVRLPKIGDIKVVLDRNLPKYSNVVIKKHNDKWYASFVIDIKEESRREIETVIGIDVNADCIVSSDGAVYKTPRPNRKFKKRIRLLQRRISRKKKGSKNRDKARRRYRKLMDRISNIRKDFIHKTSHSIVKSADLICMETLDIKSMKKGHKTAIAVQDNNWYGLFKAIEYKSKLYGRHSVHIDQWLPSTKSCSSCGNVKTSIPVTLRTYSCDECGHTESRDLNAAKNIMYWGYQTYSGQELPGAPADVLLTKLSCDGEVNSAMKQE